MQKIPVIAVVDDDEFVRGSVQSLIRSLGYKATTFSSAEAFLDSASLDDTDCLVTDLQMPGMSGVGLQNRLRAVGCRTPVIIITAFPEEQLRRQAQSGGAVAFLTKPFDGQ